MAFNQQFDSYEYPTLSLPYDKSTRDLDPTPRIVAGQNILSTVGGKNIKRPGTIAIPNTSLNKRIDRLWVYETLESPSKIYIMASAYDGSQYWTMYYNRLDGPAPGWTSCGTLRDCHASTRPHEMVVSRGLAFIKGFPASGSSEKYGTIIFDGSGSPGPAGLTFWGVPAPTVPARLAGPHSTLTGSVNDSTTTWVVATDPGFPAAPFNVTCGDETASVSSKSGTTPCTLTVVRGANGSTKSSHNSGAEVLYRDWSTSSQPATVVTGWKYVYCWKEKTGNLSCRSPLETNPDHRPSNTGGFTNRIPKIDVQGHPDTVNVPKIQIFRTTDGGGQEYFLGEINNSGAGTITVADNFLTSLGGNLDPLPDSQLDTSQVAPSLTSNQPPPTVILPQVLGTDTPAPSTKIVYYAGRFWYGIGNILLFSGQEEITLGTPEECWPTGINGNFFRFQHPIVDLDATGEALYIRTLKETHWLRGNTLDTFQVNKLFGEIGAAPSNRAGRAVGNTVAWLTHDYRVASARTSDIQILSGPLYDDIVSNLSPSKEIELGYFAELDKEFLIVNMFDKNTSQSTQWFYDIRQSTQQQQFWNPPWNIPNSAMLSDRIRESDSRRYLCFWMWNGGQGILSYWDAREQVVQDATAVGNVDYGNYIALNLTPNPAGNHVNLLRRPPLFTVVQQIQVDRTKFPRDTNPEVEFFLDDVRVNGMLPKSAIPPQRRPQSTGYNTTFYQVNEVCQRISVQITKAAVNERFELQGLAIVFRPDDGA